MENISEENNASYVGNFFKLVQSQEEKKNNINKSFATQIIKNARAIVNSVKAEGKKENKEKINYVETELKEIEEEIVTRTHISTNKPEARVAQLIEMLMDLETSSSHVSAYQ